MYFIYRFTRTKYEKEKELSRFYTELFNDNVDNSGTQLPRYFLSYVLSDRADKTRFLDIFSIHHAAMKDLQLTIAII